MKAMLITRCGCSRLLDCNLEPGQMILNIRMSAPNIVPSMITELSDGIDTVHVDTCVRKFKLHSLEDYFYLKGGERIWVYREIVG